MSSERNTLLGKTCLVTGAGAGIGLAAARALAMAGADIILCDIDPDLLAAAASLIEAEQGRTDILALQGDVRCDLDIDRVFSKIQARLGRLDILVHSAALQQPADFFGLSADAWRKTIDVNLTGTFLVCQAAARLMRSTARPNADCNGKIITLTSIHDILPRCGKFDYDAAKAGVSMLTREMALALSPWRINVNGVAPGVIDTPMNNDLMSDPTELDKAVARVPWSRVGRADEVAGLICFLASEQSNYMTGSILPIDGGRSLNNGGLLIN